MLFQTNFAVTKQNFFWWSLPKKKINGEKNKIKGRKTQKNIIFPIKEVDKKIKLCLGVL